MPDVGNLVHGALRLVSEHCTLLSPVGHDQLIERMRRLEAIVACDGEPISASTVRLRGPSGVAFMSSLCDCVARIRRAAQDAGHPALPTLLQTEDELIRIRDRCISTQVRRRPPRRQKGIDPW